LSVTPPPAELVLQSAAYSKDTYTLTLTFDRAVALVGFDGTKITVNDDTQLSLSFDATGGATITSPDTIVLSAERDRPVDGAGADVQRVGSDGDRRGRRRRTWAGVVNQVLPFP
jgi:hypothetical protein